MQAIFYPTTNVNYFLRNYFNWVVWLATKKNGAFVATTFVAGNLCILQQM